MGSGRPPGRIVACPGTLEVDVTLPDARVNKNVEGPGLRAGVQHFGGYLAGCTASAVR